jgi:hypothetical protein
MNPDPASLDRLNDLVPPPAVAWWPPAPGWYVVLALLTLAAAWLGWRFWKRRRADAYRRIALHELSTLREAQAIAELLRRTALATVSRSVIAGMTGIAWTDWLAAQSTEDMPFELRRLLTSGIYGRPAADAEIGDLRNFAARWIANRPTVSIEVRE